MNIKFKNYTLELDSLGSMVSKILLFRLCASISTYTTLQDAPFSPNKLQPLIASNADLAIPLSNKISKDLNN